MIPNDAETKSKNRRYSVLCDHKKRLGITKNKGYKQSTQGPGQVVYNWPPRPGMGRKHGGVN